MAMRMPSERDLSWSTSCGRIRFEYSLDPAGLLAKVKKLVPDASAEEVERWAISSRARFRMN